MIKIVDFNHDHIQKALEIAMANYAEARLLVPILPKVDELPDLTHFADNQLGVAAFDGGTMVGFLCAYYPREDAFGTTNVKGTFTPIHAHGVINIQGGTTFDETIDGTANLTVNNRDRIYSLLYQEAAKKWVREGILSHGISLYPNDKEAVNSFFYNGFGLRCIDAIRSLEDIPSFEYKLQNIKEHLEYCEVPREDYGLLLKLSNELTAHLGDSPTFMKFDPINEEELYRRSPEGVRYLTVKTEGHYVAYVKISAEGENFVTEDSSMMNICGAYCEPEYRGTGVYHNLLCHLMNILKKDGYQLLGVDCESFNPTARGFWLKYFTEYTHSVVRRIDDKAIGGNRE
ncbi:MAG: GNAT family N-acetyltransferase [Mobilitalea sp.]